MKTTAARWVTAVVAGGLIAALGPVDAFADGGMPAEWEPGNGRTVEDPKDTPASGLTYQYVLPFYQEHGFYLQNAAPPQRLTPGARQVLSLGREGKVTEAMQTGVDDDGVGPWRDRVVGGLTMVAKAAAKKFGGDLGESVVNALVPDLKSPSVVTDKSVKFDVTNTITVTPKRDIEARAVYYRLKTVSDIWKRDKGQDKPTLVQGGQVTDAVVGMGWVLGCKDESGRDYICQAGKDFESKNPVSDKEKKKYLPPTGAPDRLKSREIEMGSPWAATASRVSMEYPEECTVDAKAGTVRADANGAPVRSPDEVQVWCALPEYQSGLKFSHYRVQYGIGRVDGSSGSWDPNWGSGTLTSVREAPRNLPNEAALRNVRAIPADGKKRGLAFYVGGSGGIAAYPKLTLKVVPVTADCSESGQAGSLGCRNPLQDTPFEKGIDGAVAVPGSKSDLYLFKGDGYVRYNTGNDTVDKWGEGGKLLSLADHWPGLKGTGFETGIDAAVEVPGSWDSVYLFKGSKYLRYNVQEDKVEKWGGDTGVLSLADHWPGLKGTGFENGFTAATVVPGSRDSVYLFKGSDYLRYNVQEDKVEKWGGDTGVLSLADHWPGLKGTGFENGFTAAAVVPGSRDSVYFFKGSDYLRYNVQEDKVETWGGNIPVLSLGDNWPGLSDGPRRAKAS
ncbi:hemopexin repeat-containing protein [Streptomyces sp. BPTC-684]|uniref:hemopexin repeat-containing protein n=1 Tax=Streptomyces sp. BPTC-684 TaxID=3043734 RepID=UPI0024B1E548|nr:hemopexin repeat-containing protein [Streptomyces sp. BPTC-684]WHM37848.1 hemopexin repeat-containing protein [Streptomyces sp. BPTC-684]